MYFTQVCCILLAVAGYASAKGYGFGGFGGGAGGGGYGGGAGGGGYGGGAGGGSHGGGGYGGGGYGGGQEDQKPKPFNFGYEAPSGGGVHFRREQGDGSGSVQGSYGYTDEQGLYRKVDYVADAGGFKASVKTNEPGTDGKENPADVNMNVQSPPPGVQEKYNRPSYGSGGFGGPKPGFGGNGGGYGGGGHAGFGGGAGASDIGAMMMAKMGGGGGMFAGIPRSTSGKSGY